MHIYEGLNIVNVAIWDNFVLYTCKQQFNLAQKLFQIELNWMLFSLAKTEL